MDFKGGFGNLLKQAQEMQKNLESAQKELTDLEAVGEAGAAPLRVEVVVNGRHEAKKVTISPELLKEDKEILEDMLASAFNDAVRKAESAAQTKMAGLMGNMKLPEGFPGMFGGDDK